MTTSVDNTVLKHELYCFLCRLLYGMLGIVLLSDKVLWSGISLLCLKTHYTSASYSASSMLYSSVCSSTTPRRIHRGTKDPFDNRTVIEHMSGHLVDHRAHTTAQAEEP